MLATPWTTFLVPSPFLASIHDVGQISSPLAKSRLLAGVSIPFSLLITILIARRELGQRQDQGRFLA